MNLATALAAAVQGDFTPAQLFFDELEVARQAKIATETKIVAWVTASGKIALSVPKTPADADEFAASLIANGKSGVEILDK